VNVALFKGQVQGKRFFGMAVSKVKCLYQAACHPTDSKPLLSDRLRRWRSSGGGRANR